MRLDEKPVAPAVGLSGVRPALRRDPAVTRYLAAFLTAHRHVAEEEVEEGTMQGGHSRFRSGENGDSPHDPGPDIVLFNGGLFESPLFATDAESAGKLV